MLYFYFFYFHIAHQVIDQQPILSVLEILLNYLLIESFFQDYYGLNDLIKFEKQNHEVHHLQELQ